jgi:hypothetical protein
VRTAVVETEQVESIAAVQRLDETIIAPVAFFKRRMYGRIGDVISEPSDPFRRLTKQLTPYT